jgi:hypothetical protein
MPSSLLQLVNSLFQTCYNNWEQAVRTQLVDTTNSLLAYLLAYSFQQIFTYGIFNFCQVSLKIDEREVDHALQDKILMTSILQGGLSPDR